MLYSASESILSAVRVYFHSRKHRVARQSTPSNRASILTADRVLYPVGASILTADRVLYPVGASILTADRVLYPVGASIMAAVRVLYPVGASIMTADKVLTPIAEASRRPSECSFQSRKHSVGRQNA